MPIREIESMGYAVDEQTLQKFENDCGIQLEPSYRQFLLKNSACMVEPNGFYIGNVQKFNNPDNANNVLMSFHGFSDKEHCTLQYAYDMYITTGRISRDYLPIGDDPFGNAILLGVGSNNFGKLFFWNHELEGEGDTENTSEFTLLAYNFNDFIESFVDG